MAIETVLKAISSLAAQERHEVHVGAGSRLHLFKIASFPIDPGLDRQRVADDQATGRIDVRKLIEPPHNAVMPLREMKKVVLLRWHELRTRRVEREHTEQ